MPTEGPSMTNGEVAGITTLQQITVAAIVRAAGRGLLTATEARLLIDRIEDHNTTPTPSIQDSHPTGVGERTRDHALVDLERTVR
jgi:hypothetical protein